MNYPKEIMKVSELKELGYTKELIYQICHAKGSPAFKMNKGRNAHWYIRTSNLDNFVDRLHRIAK